MQVTAARCLRVVQFFGHTVKDGHVCLVMKRYTRSLADLLRASPGGRLNEGMAVYFAVQLFSALAELRAVGIVTRVCQKTLQFV